MLYYLFEYLDKILNVSGTGVFQYITFRSALALMLSLLLSTIYGKRVVSFPSPFIVIVTARARAIGAMPEEGIG